MTPDVSQPGAERGVPLRLDGFEGPMDLLLDLARRQKVDLARISILSLVEEIRVASLGQTTIHALLEAGLIEPKGCKGVPGRPTLWGTTPAFLVQFGLGDVRDLPRRQDLLREDLLREDLVQEAGAGAPDPR